ncbi:MAG: tyrosine-type recombinase/integrase [Hyphomicrobiales bacterium]
MQLDGRLISLRSLKKRGRVVFREVPIPGHLTDMLQRTHNIRENQRCWTQAKNTFLWSNEGAPMHRVTAYRCVKRVMYEFGISGAQATPKGLRHGYGVHAIRSGIQLNMLQKWMGMRP